MISGLVALLSADDDERESITAVDPTESIISDMLLTIKGSDGNPRLATSATKKRKEKKNGTFLLQ